jgi:hypothetical protein
MTQKTKQINNNYEQIKDKITLRENSFKNDHKAENFKPQKLKLDFDFWNNRFVSGKSKKNGNDDDHDYYKRQLETRQNQRHLKSSTISGTSNNLNNCILIFKINF